MRHLAIVPAIALLLACGQESDEQPTNAVPDVAGNNAAAGPAGDGTASEAPEGADPNGRGVDITDREMRWSFARTAAGPKLTYGEPFTNNVKLMLRCASGDSLRLSFVRPAGSPGGEMVVRSGGAEQRFDATAIESEIGGATIQAIAPMGSQPLQNFRGGSALEVSWEGETISVPAPGNEARQLFDACRASG